MKIIQVVIVVVFFFIANFAGYVCANSHNWVEMPAIEIPRQKPSEFERIVNAAEHIAVSFRNWEATDFK